jgi:hypothetical protein
LPGRSDGPSALALDGPAWAAWRQHQPVPAPAASRLEFDLEDKPWGPNYLHAGLDLSTDLRGRSAFNLKLSHNRHLLTRNGTEWRSRLLSGEVPQVLTELYRPALLGLTHAPRGRTGLALFTGRP